MISETERSPLIGHVNRYWESQECHSIYLGVTIFDETCWGRGLGTEALTRKAGYSLEGRLRMARPLNGQYYDRIIMGVLRSEWEPLRL